MCSKGNSPIQKQNLAPLSSLVFAEHRRPLTLRRLPSVCLSFYQSGRGKKMVAAKLTTYEEVRRRRLEENKKRMEELHLHQLSLSLTKHSSSPKLSPVKRATPRIVRNEAVRRSNRVANKPAPDYRDVVTYERADLRQRATPRVSTRTDLLNRVYASYEARALAISKAEELESGLEAGYPTFVKPMTQSHVTGGFWLGLPAHFCRRHLPRREEMFTLVDEDGQEHSTVYLARKSGLSGGWKGFAVDHDLVDGDALVFQLIRPVTFKVYIIRANQNTL